MVSRHGRIKDFTFAQTPMPSAPAGVQVHEGFLDLAVNSTAAVVALVRKARQQCPDCDVLFTGHSLGGGLAVLGGVLYAASTGDTVNIHSFAGPRVGNPAFVQWLPKLPIASLWRVTSQHDPGSLPFASSSPFMCVAVPHLPPQSAPLLPAYAHPTQEVWDQNGDDRSFRTCR